MSAMRMMSGLFFVNILVRARCLLFQPFMFWNLMVSGRWAPHCHFGFYTLFGFREDLDN